MKGYPLVICYIPIENNHRKNEFTHYQHGDCPVRYVSLPKGIYGYSNGIDLNLGYLQEKRVSTAHFMVFLYGCYLNENQDSNCSAISGSLHQENGEDWGSSPTNNGDLTHTAFNEYF